MVGGGKSGRGERGRGRSRGYGLLVGRVGGRAVSALVASTVIV